MSSTQIFLDGISESSTESTFVLPIIEKHVVGWSNMIHIPEGYFWIGCDPDHNGGFPCYFDDIRRGYTDAYYIDKTEVTTAQYARCVDVGICRPPQDFSSKTRRKYFNNPRFSDFPVIHVIQDDAYTYCRWAGKDLPSEVEWQKAARGPDDKRAYPWGDEDPNCTLTNSYNNATSTFCVGDTVKVGSRPDGASPYGVLDMSGNVSEMFIQGGKLAYYYFNGSYDSDWSKLTIYTYVGWSENWDKADLGFRCVIR